MGQGRGTERWGSGEGGGTERNRGSEWWGICREEWGEAVKEEGQRGREGASGGGDGEREREGAAEREGFLHTPRYDLVSTSRRVVCDLDLTRPPRGPIIHYS